MIEIVFPIEIIIIFVSGKAEVNGLICFSAEDCCQFCRVVKQK